MRIAYVGGYGTGKTTKLVEHYCAHKTQVLSTPGYWLVPTADHLEDTRQLLSKKYNPLCNDQVFTLSQLSQRHTQTEPLSELEKQLILREAMTTLSLRIFAKATGHHLFYQTVSQLIAEWKHYCLSPADIEKINNSKLQELANIYIKYEQVRQAKQKYDSEDILQKALQEKLPEQDFLILDGFQDLTPLQEKLVSHFAQSSANVYASATHPELQSFFGTLDCQIQTLTEQKRTTTLEKKKLIADNRYLELENIAREIIRLHKQGYAWGDCALIFRQIHEYTELIQDVFTYYNIPVTIHTGIYVHHDRFVRKLLESCTTAEDILRIKDYVKENNLLEELHADARIPELTQVIRYSLKAYQRLLTVIETLQKNNQLSLELLKESLTQDMLSLSAKPQDHVQVYDALIARNKEHKVIFLANLTQGSFPLRISENSLCTDQERQVLSPRLRTTRTKLQQEHELFIQASTRATEKLYYSYALSEITGQALSPSHFVPKEELPIITRSISDSLPAIADAVSTQELIDTLIYNLYKTYTQQDLEVLLKSREDLHKIRGLIETKQDPIRQTTYYKKAQEIIAKVHRISAKNIELFTACPFAFFSKMILKLKTEPDDPSPMIIGEIIHKTLELFRKQPENILELFEAEFPAEKWRELFKHLHPRQQQVERERIRAILEKYAAWDSERSKNRHSKTTGLEEKIEYQLGDTTIVGVIDRVDTLPDSSTLIIDYKTGQFPPLSLRELDEGYLPQAWLYAFLYQELKKATVIGTEYQQVLTTKTKGIYAETHTELLNISSRQIMSSEKFKETLENTKQKLIQVLQDIHGAKFYGFARHCENICEYTAVCRMTYERS